MEEKTTYRPIYGAANYLMGSDDCVVNVNSNKKLTKFWRGNYYATRVVADDGRQKWVNHNFCNVATSSEPPDQEMVTVEGYPDYKVTPWGAVWKCTNLPKKKRNTPFIVSKRYLHGSDYVRLVTEDGRVHLVRVDKIMEEAYPND
jgi:hypothetical protein